jgi:hypothetical protein
MFSKFEVRNAAESVKMGKTTLILVTVIAKKFVRGEKKPEPV